MQKIVRGTMYATCGNNPNEWIVIINGTEHSIRFSKDKNGHPKLYVDDKEMLLPKTFITNNLGIDYPVQIEGRIIHCTYDMEKFDIAIKGRYVNSKKKYYPLKGWILVTVVTVLLIIAAGVLITADISDVFEISGMISIFLIELGLMGYLDYLNKKASEE